MKMTAILYGLNVKNKHFINPMVDRETDSLILKDGTRIEYTGDENDGPNDCFNYADWSALEDTGFFEDNITKENLKIKKCEDYGFTINGYFVPCYSTQNGYYTNEIDIIVRDSNGKKIKEYSFECDVNCF